MKKALIFRGGWDGHEPALVSQRFGKALRYTLKYTFWFLNGYKRFMHTHKKQAPKP